MLLAFRACLWMTAGRESRQRNGRCPHHSRIERRTRTSPWAALRSSADHGQPLARREASSHPSPSGKLGAMLQTPRGLGPSLASYSVTIAVQMPPVAWVCRAHGRCSRRPGLGAIGKLSATVGRQGAEGAGRSGGRPTVTVVASRLSVVVATFGIETAWVRERRRAGTAAPRTNPQIAIQLGSRMTALPHKPSMSRRTR